ncbi:MAG: ankyrin repeat domain-containing protein, partial [Bacteroidota bacterium]
LDILKKLHASGEPIESPSETGITTLMAVAGGAQEFHQKHLIQVAKFIDGKFVSPQDAEYKTLNPVTEESFLAVMDYLILHGADVNAQTHEVRHSPLIYCATNNTPALGQKLLDAGASVNYQDQDGMSALHWASRRGFAAVVKMLLENKADPNLGENYGFTPLHEAAENNHLKVLELLLANGADKSIGIQKGFGDFKAGCTAYDIARLKNYGAIIKGLT